VASFCRVFCSEALLRARFEYAKRLQLVSGRPSILFLDELVRCYNLESVPGFLAS